MLVEKPRESYDIVVIGAGMVGASFTAALQKILETNPASVLIVEAMQVDKKQGPTSPSFDDRSTALSYGSSKILQKAGIWPSLVEQLTPIKKIHVSDKGHFGTASLDCGEQRVEALGYVVENRNLGQALNRSLQDSKTIDFLCSTTIDSIKPEQTGMSVLMSISDGQSVPVQASLVVLADGGRSPICSQLGIKIETEQYRQKAIIANVALEKPHQYIAYERFTETGPLAILPLAELDGVNRGAMVWTVSEDDGDSLMALSDHEILQILQERFGYRLGKFSRIGKRNCYPLTLAVAQEQIRPGLVLLGNVAHTLHPVAGQGFNLALRDADSLAKILAEAHISGTDIGSMSVLQRFVELQCKDQDRTINFSHYLTRLFSSNRSAAVWARKFGLASIDILPAVKQSFARTAMGLADR